MKITTGLAVLAVLGLGAASLPAEGLYVLGAVGAKDVYDQDFNDYYAGAAPGYGYGYNVPYYEDEGLAEGDLSLGWRFPGLMAVEGTVGVDSQRDASSWTYLGDSDLQVNPAYTFSLGPVFCWDRSSWWFAESGVTELGLRAEYSILSGSEAVDGYGSQDFSAATPGFGIFVRALNIWNPTGFTIGIEAGYDYQYFNSLTLSNTSGGFAGNNGQDLTNYSGGKAYLDNSGGYLRLVIGWSQGSSRPADVVPRRPYWRRRAYGNYPDQDYGD